MARRKIGWYIDTHQELKDERDELLAEVDVVKKKIAKHEELTLERFNKEDIDGAKGELATGYIEEVDRYSLKDRRKFEAYIKKTGHFELFQGRVSTTAYRELLALGKKPAGVGVFHQINFRTRRRPA